MHLISAEEVTCLAQKKQIVGRASKFSISMLLERIKSHIYGQDIISANKFDLINVQVKSLSWSEVSLKQNKKS